jgi:hypothetical protein
MRSLKSSRLSVVTEVLRLIRISNLLALIQHSNVHRDLQIYVGKGNNDSRFISSQKLSETIDAFTYVP